MILSKIIIDIRVPVWLVVTSSHISNTSANYCSNFRLYSMCYCFVENIVTIGALEEECGSIFVSLALKKPARIIAMRI